jgi:biotin carboxyl carrier protein
MKMEHNLRVPRPGKIARVDVKIGSAVASGSTVVVLEDA